MSLPSRERGLKSLDAQLVGKSLLVAPFAGAWIEIRREQKPRKVKGVAPFAGAWIEIVCITSTDYPGEVAPFAGAWIEIYPPASRKCKLITSLPSRERGLK